MSAKHTPGPWQYSVAFNGDCGIKADGTGVFAEAFADIRRAREDNRDEALANARLIAAAPDLLALLGEAMNTRAPDYVETEYPGWFDRVRAALSKAGATI